MQRKTNNYRRTSITSNMSGGATMQLSTAIPYNYRRTSV